MESHEVLRQTMEDVGVKKVAHDLRVSTSLVYKWCEEDTSGARNPLDRLLGIMESAGSHAPAEWLCRKRGGFFVRDPAVELGSFDAAYIAHTQRMLENFSSLLQAISESMNDDNVVDAEEAEDIRAHWEKLKGYAETFVCACEQGLFDPNRDETRGSAQ